MAFPEISQQDVWWRHVQPDNPLPAMALGARIRQDALQYGLQVQQLKVQQEQQRILTEEHAAKLKIQTKIMEGSKELAATMADPSFSFSDDVSVRKAYEVFSRNPYLMGTGVYKGFEDMVYKAAEAKRKAADPTALMQNVGEIDRLNAEADKIAATNPQEAERLRKRAALMMAGVGPAKETIRVTNADGTVTEIIKGGGSEVAGGLTTATQSQVQQRMIGFEKASNMASELYSKITPEMIGARGLVGEVLVDKGLAQMFPQLANLDRIDGRTMLRIFNENMIKTLKADAQVNRDEEKRLLAALPDPDSFFGTEDAAKKQINRFRAVLRDYARIDAGAAGKPVPQWAMTVKEIAALIDAKKMTREQGLDLMRKYGIKE